jgi:predicted lipid-binding transport protein (Tim44 family)
LIRGLRDALNAALPRFGLVTFTLALLVAGLTVMDTADAKRFGGGRSFGMQRPMFSRPVLPRRPPASPTRQYTRPGGRAAPASGMSRWLGPLAGLAAGGLLASLFFGDAFSGVQVLDLLLIGAVIFGIMALLRRSRPATAAASHAGGGAATAAPQYFEGTPAGDATGSLNLPAWFDEAAFIDGAKQHFNRLQTAWDEGDMESIREYVTPSLFEALAAERAALGPDKHETEVITLDASLVDFFFENGLAVASVHFSGLVRESDGGANDFSEVWHVQQKENRPDADWLVAGIQQV